MTKQEARTRMKILRKELSDVERERKNQAIRERLFAFLTEQKKTWFFPFVSYGSEVDTLELIRIVLAEGSMQVAVPRVEGKDMDFYAIHSMEELQPGYQGIPEPVTTARVFAEDGIMLLPGLAFDRKKNRVGYGGGFYDRYLEKYDSAGLVTVAAAYDFQIVDSITAEEFDKRPQWIITDRELF